jgi:hypothetical protein
MALSCSIASAVSGQQFEAVHSASIAARTANSAKVRANNINIALMAISHQQFVSLQPENLFHDKSPLNYKVARTGLGMSVTSITFWSFSERNRATIQRP